MADLQNAQIDQSYPSLIKTFDNGPISTSGFPLITDGQGTNTMIAMSATELQLGTNINTQYFKQYANSGGSTELKDVLIRMDDATASQYFQLDAANAGMGAGANYFLASAAGNSIVGPLDLSGATVTGLPAGGLESGTGTSSMQSAASLTTTPANGSGNDSIALGNNARAISFGGIALGTNTSSTGVYTICIGYGSNTGSEGGVCIGNNTNAGFRSVALGTNARANGSNSVSIGKDSDATQAGAVALGNGVQAVTANTATVNLFQIAGYAGMNYADDAAAATGGIPLGGVYHTSGALKIRIA